MQKLDFKALKKQSTIIFDTKTEMLEYISKAGFKDDEKLIILRKRKKWILWWR